MRPALLLAALFATPAVAQETPPPIVVTARPAAPDQPPATMIVEPVAMMIAAFDADGDARVTRVEFDAGLRRSFDAIDTRRTGSLGYIAFSDWSERWMGDRNTLPSPFETDRDGDNRISFDELAARFDLLFARFDKDKDGVIVRSELVTVRPQAPRPPNDGRRKR
ncbi:EF-hand domain-containing protein [Sphingomonas sp. HF-S4]|uniref:EF-hand domain-containing protein n=1 Tax=Sphingomonas agrestis TaxID=3080540 RepID=A0ABU3YAA1_9SPHN|nr:EF-hand domain-containing protein [Sphingomonas sp. HF-S4]MDV3458345.1 EF-hand domain-containing protein [Sphingomonas sp. HF-S4]